MGGYVHPILQARHLAAAAAPRRLRLRATSRRMTATDVFVCLGEFDHEAGAEAMFDDGHAGRAALRRTSTPTPSSG